MIIKKYLVKTIDELQARVTSDLGKHAEILTTRTIKMHGGESLSNQEQIEAVVGIEEEHLNHHILSNKYSTVDLYELCEKLIRNHVNENDHLFPECDSTLNELILKGVAYPIAKEIIDSISSCEKWYEELFHAVVSRIPTSGPLSFVSEQTTTVAFVGPQGVGKTTALLKLAIQSIEQKGKSVGVITYGTERIGVTQSITSIADHFNFPITILPDKSKIQDALETYRGYDLVLIDSFGGIHSNTNDFDDVEELLNNIPQIQTHIVISAMTKDCDLEQIIKKYLRYHPCRILVTHFDQTSSTGFLLNVCETMKVPLSYISTGSNLLTDIEVADPDQLARTLITSNSRKGGK